MLVSRKKYLNKDKLPPGTIRKHFSTSEDVKIIHITYNSDTFEKKLLKSDEIKHIEQAKNLITWIHCPSTLNHEVLEAIGSKFNIHSLILENIQNIEHRPKLNDTENFNFIIQKSLKLNNNELEKNHIGYLMFPDMIITFANGNPFTVIEERLAQNQGKVRKRGSDYLLFCLMDVLTDDYFELLDILEQQVQYYEDVFTKSHDKLDIDSFLKLKNQIDIALRFTKPLSAIIDGIIKSTRPPIDQSNLIYFKDLLNNTLQIADMLDIATKSIDSILNLSINISGYKMNKIMKILTILSTIFMPLTFIAGIYGMNFRYMPELEFQAGYPIVLGVMVIVVINMIIFFKKNRWF